MTTELKSADIHLIQRILPHRYPFLLVDKVVEIDGYSSACGIKNVTMNEPHFQGHFPGTPIMPGVTIVEAMAQTAGPCRQRIRGTPSASNLQRRAKRFRQSPDRVESRRTAQDLAVQDIRPGTLSRRGKTDLHPSGGER